jgi:hypothetical protein
MNSHVPSSPDPVRVAAIGQVIDEEQLRESQAMRSIMLRRAVLLSFVAAGACAVACEREGPAERAGKNVDNAAKNTGKAIERAGENIQDAAKDAQR